MKTIFRIARTELQVLFFSPVAWLILVVFTFQAGIIYTGLFDTFIRNQSLGWKLYSTTLSTFGGYSGLFTVVQSFLFLYVPLLTMNSMSREYASGSIKLLYSSPLTNYQIIFGKYLSLLIYCLGLIAVLGVFGIFSGIVMENTDLPVILSGLLGLFLLAAAYAAIGLFMSSLTSYSVVAAMGSLAIFALLSYVKTMWQDIGFVRDITYWLAISGRSETFISGLLTSEDILYFLIVIGLFLGLTIVKLQSGRQKSPWMVNFGKYAAVFSAAMLMGYFSAKPELKSFYDTTKTKTNTLTKSSQDVVSKLKGGLTIHTYSNMLDPNYYTAVPQQQKYDIDRFKQYTRFKPDIKIKHYYYYHTAENPQLDKQYPGLNAAQRFDTLNKIHNWKFDVAPYQNISKEVNLEPESFRFVRVLERESGEKTFLRVFKDMYVHPFESEITAAFKRLTMKLPIVGFVSGHGERRSNGPQDRGYNMIAQEKSFRYALVNQGFDFEDLSLNNSIPEGIKILVLADPKTQLSPLEKENLEQYVGRGGNLIIAGEPNRYDVLNPLTESIGVKFLPGTLLKQSEKLQQDLLILRPTHAAGTFSHHLDAMRKREMVLTMPGAAALDFDSTKGFKVTTLFRTDSSGSWNEMETKNFIDDSATMNLTAGETEISYPTVLALSRKVNNKEQKILVTGDADWLSNAELGMTRNEVKAANYSLISAAFYWLSDEEMPINMKRETPPDRKLNLGQSGWDISKVFLKWVFPICLIIIGVIISIRRRGK